MKTLLVVAGVALLAAGAWMLLFQDQKGQDEKPAEGKPSGTKPSQLAEAPVPPPSAIIVPHASAPRKPTLTPALFSEEPVRAAYQVAKDKPELLEKMACYCGCMKSVENHANNLECFADNHGVGCALCRRIALDASALQEKGMSVENIKKEIDSRYAR